jgi:predicted TIM-barrel fold metal-dependent hydrolase
MRLCIAFSTLVLMAGCARGPALRGGTPDTSAESRSPGDIVPRVDHHQHLLSPAGAALTSSQVPPEVQLPEALAGLLRAREQRWNDKTRLAELYVDDVLVFSGSNPGWVRGRQAAAAYLSQHFDGPYRFIPTAARSEGSAGLVVGLMEEADGVRTDRFAFFHIGVSRGSDGVWRIASETHLFPGPLVKAPETARQLIERLDEAGIRRAVVLSDAYYFDSPGPVPVQDEYDKVRAENDWTAQQVAQFPDRLIGFCSFNPLKDHALAELERCAASHQFQGLKLHFAGAALDFRSPEQVARVRRVMEAANRHRLPILIHAQPGGAYGREEAGIFLHQLVAAAPDVPVTVAHLWGGGNYSAEALAAYAEAVSSGDPATRNLSFDVAEVWIGRGSPEERETIVQRMRQIGLERLLYGSDAGKGTPRAAWEAFRQALPLTEEEFRTLANNVAPYLREP